MIEALCGCGYKWVRAESAPEKAVGCPKCGRTLSIACAEQLPEGAGAADFDACLEVVSGPGRVGERIFLGGVMELTLGKHESAHVRLPGERVSRQHCHLTRVDFGPSKWSVRDHPSTHGLFVDGRRVEFKELEHGDELTVGEYKLRYVLAEPPPPPPPTEARGSGLRGRYSATALVQGRRISGVIPVIGAGAAPAPGTGIPCPSCERELAADAKICVDCGIWVDGGRPVLTTAIADENAINMHAEAWLWLTSWFVWVTPLPMPLKSEAYGSKKPWAIWGIALVTVIASVAFLIGACGVHNPLAVPGKNFQLWAPGRVFTTESMLEDRIERITREHAREIISAMDEDERKEFEEVKAQLRGHVPDDELDSRAVRKMHVIDQLVLAAAAADREASETETPAQFSWYQLVTHAFLHDPSSVLRCVLHLGGNLLFMLVFGTRVNALLGNVATLVVYPILAVGAAAVHLWLGDRSMPSIGASGAIMGLAGMYLVLFPVPRVYCGMWCRLLFFWFGMVVFTVRGFWVLLIYFAYDAVMLALHARGNTAHWAHIGGFLLGVTIALGLLMSRRVYCGGADLLSVALGRRAWPLIGRPARWNDRLARVG